MAVCFSLTSLSTTPQTSSSGPTMATLNTFYTISSKTLARFTFNPLSKPSALNLFAKPPLTHLRSPPRNTIRCLFTGIVEEMGEIKQLGASDGGGFDMRIGAATVLDGVHLGDSIAVNGTCLTVTEFDASHFTVGLAPETLRKTSLVELEPGSLVNLERAVLPTSRMGGHFLQGHVDGTGEIVSMVPEEDSLWIKVKTTKEILKYVVPKGYIAVDGTSLTVVDVFDDEECFNFMLVAYTQQKVVIPLKKVGQKVNLEVDILGKYVERLLSSGFVDSIKSK
ncbi:riboflavin synthase [Rosa chinensis]|uniref:riboflavin synthase n=1 Tax=Rosa chinensis TaxID=74649 RepID=UPI000D08D3F2|nr:riboflavin synthase [Rosa chinensis]XP_024174672.1 riboflavin synthase [Rosa chinensis]